MRGRQERIERLAEDRRRLRYAATLDRRAAGEIEAGVEPAEAVREASPLFPRRRIEEANKVPLRVAANGKRYDGERYPRSPVARVGGIGGFHRCPFRNRLLRPLHKARIFRWRCEASTG